MPNIHAVITYDHGVYGRWLANTALYALVSAGGAALLSTAAGYGFAKYEFAGKRVAFAVVRPERRRGQGLVPLGGAGGGGFG